MELQKPSSRVFPSQEYHIRPAKSFEEAWQIWWQFFLKNGWNRGPNELETFVNHSQSRGVLLVFPNNEDQAVGHIAAIINDNSTGWVSLFVVDDVYQGRGLGAGLWNEMMLDFKNAKTAVIGLDAVPQQIATYERRGFVETMPNGIHSMSRPLLNSRPLSSATQSALRATRMQSYSYEQLAKFDRKYTGFHRPKLWQNLLDRKDVVGLVLSERSATEEDEISGCILMRRCPSGCRIGPVYADTASHADSLLESILEAANPAYIEAHSLPALTETDAVKQNNPSVAIITLSAWSGNPAALKTFEKYGFREAGVYHRMWYEGRATPEQSQGGAHEQGLFAILDGAIG